MAGGSAALSEPSITRLAAHSAGSTLAVVASTPDASGAGAAPWPLGVIEAWPMDPRPQSDSIVLKELCA